MARRAWYKDKKYDEPMGPEFITGDKSTVEVAADGDVFCIRRTYADGYVQEIHYRHMPGGWRKYLREDPSPASPVKHLTPAQRTEAFETALANGEVRVTARGPIPGAGLGVHEDHATRKRYATSQEFEEEFARQRISYTMRSDHSTMHTPSDNYVPTPGVSIERFDATNGGLPPMPKLNQINRTP